MPGKPLRSPFRSFAGGRPRATLPGNIRKLSDEFYAGVGGKGGLNIRVFGSVARGETDSRSDVDLLVDLEPGRSLLDLARLQRKLEQLLTVKVDVVSARGLRERVRETVLRDALPL